MDPLALVRYQGGSLPEQERFLSTAGLGRRRASTASFAEQSEIFRIQRWIADARDRLFELELDRAPSRELSRRRRAMAVAATFARWAVGLYVTFVLSTIAFAFFAAFFAASMLGWWKRTREVHQLRVWIQGAETTLADARRRGYVVSDEQVAIAGTRARFGTHEEDDR